MVVITNSQREILLDPIGNNVWSGATVQSINTSSITWSLAKYMYSLQHYWFVPMGLLIGAVAPVIQFGINKLFPITSKYEVNTAVIFTYVAWREYLVFSFADLVQPWVKDERFGEAERISALYYFAVSTEAHSCFFFSILALFLLYFHSQLRKHFIHWFFDCGRDHQSNLDPKTPPKDLQRLQLSRRCSVGWRSSSHDLHLVFCSIRCCWKSDKLPNLAWKSNRQSRLVQRRRVIEIFSLSTSVSQSHLASNTHLSVT